MWHVCNQKKLELDNSAGFCRPIFALCPSVSVLWSPDSCAKVDWLGTGSDGCLALQQTCPSCFGGDGGTSDGTAKQDWYSCNQLKNQLYRIIILYMSIITWCYTLIWLLAVKYLYWPPPFAAPGCLHCLYCTQLLATWSLHVLGQWLTPLVWSSVACNSWLHTFQLNCCLVINGDYGD